MVRGAAPLRPDARGPASARSDVLRSVSAVGVHRLHLAALTLRGRLPVVEPAGDLAHEGAKGTVILEAILDIWPAETLGIADRGIREGILRSLMARDGYQL